MKKGDLVKGVDYAVSRYVYRGAPVDRARFEGETIVEMTVRRGLRDQRREEQKRLIFKPVDPTRPKLQLKSARHAVSTWDEHVRLEEEERKRIGESTVRRDANRQEIDRALSKLGLAHVAPWGVTGTELDSCTVMLSGQQIVDLANRYAT